MMPSCPGFPGVNLLQTAVEAEDECDELKQKNAALLPKAEAYRTSAAKQRQLLARRDGEAARIPGMATINLIKFLRRDGVLVANNVASSASSTAVISVSCSKTTLLPTVRRRARYLQLGISQLKLNR